MAKLNNIALVTLLAFLSLHNITVSTDSSPSQAPAPAPHSGADSPPPPPVPPPTPVPSPTPLPSSEESPADEDKHIPAPAPEKAADLKKEGSEERSGMSGGKKVGIAFGVIGAVCLVGVGGFVYKKRKENTRRSEYGYDARRDIL